MASEYYRVTDWQTRLRSLGHAVGVVVAAFLVGTLLFIATAQLLPLFGVQAESLSDLPATAYAAVVASQFVGFMLAVYGYLRWRGEVDLFSISLPTLRELGWIVGGFVALFGATTVLGFLIQFLGLESAPNAVVTENQDTPVRFLYLIPVTILFVAPAEELVFRGVVQGLFRRAYGIVPGIVLASLLFGVAHTLALQGGGSAKLTTILIITVLGVILGSLYELTDNLAVPIGVHGIWNAFLFGTQYLVASGALSG